MKTGTLSEMKAFIETATKAELEEFVAECQTSCTCNVSHLIDARNRLSKMEG